MLVVVIELCVGCGETFTTHRSVDRCSTIMVVKMFGVDSVHGHDQMIIITLINGHA